MADGIVITGPTASGKTDLAIAVAHELGGEIISVDSRQIYRGMDIGTAKPSVRQRREIPHFGIDELSPGERYSAGRFASDARRWIDGSKRRGRTPILAGGTGFFLRALTHPLFKEPPLDADRKERLKRYFSTFSRVELLRWLGALDEVSAQRLAGTGGRQRIARAIEIALLTGQPLSSWHREREPGPRPLSFLTFVLMLPKAVLFERIDRRVDHMLAAGLVAEVQGLLAAGFDEHAPGMNATGYIELLPFLRGETSLESAAAEIKRATRRYARRQLTWFRHQLGGDPIVLDGTRPTATLAAEVARSWYALAGGES